MDPLEVRPGNREKGWNDPPEFLHAEGSNVSVGASKLNKRVSHTLDGTTTLPVDTNKMPVLTAPPKLPPVTKSDFVQSNEEKVVSVEEKLEEVVSKDRIVKVLEAKVQFCKDNSIANRVCDDILKRIKVFSTNWEKLNEKVKSKMNNLASALDESEYSKANDLHVQLMMDYASEVSQWMVGIKRLIHELMNLSKN